MGPCMAVVGSTTKALLEAIGRALWAITPQDAVGYFGHCGYPLDAQPS